MRYAPPILIALAIAIGVAVLQGGGGGGGGYPAQGNLWIDSDGGTCARSSSSADYVDATACSPSTTTWYTNSSKGDSVKVKTTGGKAVTSITSQWLFTNAQKKAGSGNCNYRTGSLADCIWVTPESGTINFNADVTNGQIRICADFLRISGLDFTDITFIDGLGDTVSKPALSMGAGDNGCGTTPPRDILIEDATFRGPANIAGGTYNAWIVNSTAAISHNLPWQFGGQGNNGAITGVNNSGIDGVDFQAYNWQDDSPTHMECIHMDFTGTANTVRNSRFSACPVYSIRVEAEGSAENRQINHVIENNFFDRGGASQSANLNFDCHDNNCAITGNTVRFNSFSGGTFGPTNDCEQTGPNTCTQTGNTFYGNVAGTCASNSAIFALGWVSTYNVYTGSQSGICTGDATSLYSQTPSYASPGSFSYDLHLSGAEQGADNLVPTSSVCPATDIDGTPRPLDTNCDAGADEQQTDPAGFGTGASAATCNATPCTAGSWTNLNVASSDGGGQAVTWQSKIYVPAGMSGNSPLLVYYGGPIGTAGTEDWPTLARTHRIKVLTFWSCPAYNGSAACASYRYAHHGFDLEDAVCGPAKNALCDDIVPLLDTLTYVEATYSIDTTKLYAMGDSKGGAMTIDTMCSPSANVLFRGFAPASTTYGAYTSKTNPINCEYIEDGGTNRDYSVELQYGDNDTFALWTGASEICAYSGYAIVEPGCYQSSSNRWKWAPLAGTNQKRTDLGCGGVAVTSTFGATSKLVHTSYSDCPVGVRAVAVMKVIGGGHAYSGMNGIDGFDAGDQAYTWLRDN